MRKRENCFVFDEMKHEVMQSDFHLISGCNLVIPSFTITIILLVTANANMSREI